MANRIKRSAALFKSSWQVLQQHRSLLLLPIVSAVTTLIVVASFAVPVVAAIAFDDDLRNEIQVSAAAAAAESANADQPQADASTAAIATDPTPPVDEDGAATDTSGQGVSQAWQATGIGYLAIFYLVTSFVVIFFNAALVAAANEHFNGRPSGLMVGIRVAASRLPAIFLWTVVAATVGLVLRMISERSGLVGKIVIALVGVVWSIATYFAIPIVVIEGTGPFRAIGRSASTIKKTWGETLVLAVGFGIIGLFVGLLGIGALVGGVIVVVAGATSTGQGSLPLELLGATIALAGIVILVAWSILAGTLKGITQTALYRFASTGEVPDGFTREHLEAAFQSKKRKSLGLG